MKARVRVLVVAAVSVLASAVHADGAGTVLQHDVFNRPNLAVAPALPAASEASAAAWRPALRAIVMAGPQSMALVDRSVVEMGGRLDGYRLEAVDESSVVFVKGRQRVTLFLGKEGNLW